MRHSFAKLLFVALAALVAPACATAAQGPPQTPNALQSGIALYQQARYAEAEVKLRSATGPEASAYLAGSLAKQKKYVRGQKPQPRPPLRRPTHPVAVAAASRWPGRRSTTRRSPLSAAIVARTTLAYAISAGPVLLQQAAARQDGRGLPRRSEAHAERTRGPTVKQLARRPRGASDGALGHRRAPPKPKPREPRFGRVDRQRGRGRVAAARARRRPRSRP